MDENILSQSPSLMTPGDTALLVIDMQEKLLPVISGNKKIAWNVRRLIDGAKIFNIPVLGTEQYPQGLGPTIPELAERLGPLPAKMTMSCGGCTELVSVWKDSGRSKILLCGVESHVCVQQTALDFLAAGWNVFVAVDAVGSRYEMDYKTALHRMEISGATLTTVEAALFEWCRAAGTPEFKQISRLAKETSPDEREVKVGGFVLGK